MTPTTTITTLTLHHFNSTPPATTEIASGTPLNHDRNPRTVAVLAWLTERLDWEDRLDHLNKQKAARAEINPPVGEAARDDACDRTRAHQVLR
jgi:hypothetical protein